MDVDILESDLNDYTRVKQVTLDTDPLMWWTRESRTRIPSLDLYGQTVPDCVVSVTFVSPERLFISVGLVKSDL